MRAGWVELVHCDLGDAVDLVGLALVIRAGVDQDIDLGSADPAHRLGCRCRRERSHCGGRLTLSCARFEIRQAMNFSKRLIHPRSERSNIVALGKDAVAVRRRSEGDIQANGGVVATIAFSPKNWHPHWVAKESVSSGWSDTDRRCACGVAMEPEPSVVGPITRPRLSIIPAYERRTTSLCLALERLRGRPSWPLQVL